MCDICAIAARTAAEKHAAVRSAELKGHGRAAHGRDAGRRKKKSEDSAERDEEAAWNHIYEETYNRVFKQNHPKKGS